MNNSLMNILGEIINVADIVGMDGPVNAPQSFNLGAFSGTVSLPSSSPSGQNGAPVFQIGNVSSNEIYSKSTEMWMGAPGIYSLPMLPTSSKATDGCQVLTVNHNNQNIGIAYRDTRNLVGINCQPGDTVLYSPAGAAKVKCSQDGSVYIGTNASSGDKTYLQISPQGLYYKSPWVNISADQNGFVVTAGGATFRLGTTAGLPIPGLGSNITMTAGQINIQGLGVSLGVGPAFSQVVCPIVPVWAPETPLPPFTSIASPSVCVSLT